MLTFLIALVSAVFFPGIIARTKSVLSCRRGPGLWQHWYDVRRLWQKETLYAPHVSWVYKVAPVIQLATLVVALVVLPFQNHAPWAAFEGDFVFFALALALGRFFMVLAALDTASAFEGMGANREVLYSVLLEPAFFILMGAMAMITGKTSLQAMFHSFTNWSDPTVVFLLIISVYVLFQILVVENGRIPIDDPKTHLELTMIHEVMILDYTGVDLALIHVAGWLRFAVYGVIISNLIIPAEWHVAGQIVATCAVHALLAVVIGIQESFMVRERMKKNPTRIFTLVLLSVIVFIGVLLMMNKV